MRLAMSFVAAGVLAALAAVPARAQTAPRTAPGAGVQALLDASPETVRARYGEPDMARTEGRGAFWTYRLPACALYVFFRAQDGGGLAVSGASAGPRRRGQPAPGVEACLAEAAPSTR